MTKIYEKERAVSERVKSVLEAVVSRRALHGRWLNTLAFMEYIGTRKILKSLPAEALNETLLRHIHEEASHSLFFKKLARKVFPSIQGFREEEMLAPKPCSAYFQSLDKMSARLAGRSAPLNYLYTTWAVETRATAVYSLYNQILKNKGFFFSLNPVLKDEKSHLKQVQTSIEEMDTSAAPHFRELKEFEEKAFSLLLQHLEKEALC